MKIVRASHPHRYSIYEENVGVLDKLLIKVKRDQPNFNRRMFDKDFARIFSLSSRREENLFEITSNDEELTARLIGDVRAQNVPRPVDNIIQEMVGDIAQSLIRFDESYYFLTDGHEPKKINVVSFPADRIFNFIRVYFQLLPKRREWHWNNGDREMVREFRILDRSRLMHFRLPRSLKRMLSGQNVILASIDYHQNSPTVFFPHATHENPKPKNDFDFQVWRDTQDYALYRATRKTGWNRGSRALSRRSDFFNCHRLIRFRRNQLRLRDHILAQLSSEFTRVGKYYSAGFHIVVTPTNALPTVTDLDELEARLSREEAGFTEVMDYCFKR